MVSFKGYQATQPGGTGMHCANATTPNKSTSNPQLVHRLSTTHLLSLDTYRRSFMIIPNNAGTDLYQRRTCSVISHLP